MSSRNPDCKKRVAAWCLLAVILIAVFLISGYALSRASDA